MRARARGHDRLQGLWRAVHGEPRPARLLRQHGLLHGGRCGQWGHDVGRHGAARAAAARRVRRPAAALAQLGRPGRWLRRRLLPGPRLQQRRHCTRDCGGAGAGCRGGCRRAHGRHVSAGLDGRGRRDLCRRLRDRLGGLLQHDELYNSYVTLPHQWGERESSLGGHTPAARAFRTNPASFPAPPTLSTSSIGLLAHSTTRPPAARARHPSGRRAPASPRTTASRPAASAASRTSCFPRAQPRPPHRTFRSPPAS